MDQPQPPLVFITGASRSGTTLMSFILRRHSAIHGLNELQLFGEFWQPGQAQELTREQLLNALSWAFAREEHGILLGKPDDSHKSRAVHFLEAHQGSTAEIFAQLLSTMALDANKQIACEQTPRNIFYAEKLLDVYPNAHIVHMLRDPRAVLASQKNRWRRRSLAADKSKVPLSQMLRVKINYHPYTVCKLWNRATAEACRLASHDRFHIVRFEDLLTHGETTVQHLCEQMGLDFNPDMLNVKQINSSHHSGAAADAQGLKAQAIDVWQQELSNSERQIVDRRCAKLMQQSRYVQSSNNDEASELMAKLAYLPHLAGVALFNPKRALIQLRALAG